MLITALTNTQDTVEPNIIQTPDNRDRPIYRFTDIFPQYLSILP